MTPNSSSDRIERIEALSDGTSVLKLRVRARAQDGDANEAVLKLLAKSLEIRRSALRLTSGATARVKTVAVTGEAQNVMQRLSRFTQSTDAGGG